jgi:hypothetical protein
MAVGNILTKEFLHNIFDYCDGKIFWKAKLSSKTHIGTRAGCLSSDGYRYVGINKKRYSEHRIIFLMEKGYLPKLVDHIDNNPLNNKIENLREATNFQNSQNAKLAKTNTSGFKGVFWHKINKKWLVSLKIQGKNKHFGYFKDLELAALVVQEARNKYHGSFANHG